MKKVQILLLCVLLNAPYSSFAFDRMTDEGMAEMPVAQMGSTSAWASQRENCYNENSYAGGLGRMYTSASALSGGVLTASEDSYYGHSGPRRVGAIDGDEETKLPLDGGWEIILFLAFLCVAYTFRVRQQGR